jgi:hypothetical protein
LRRRVGGANGEDAGDLGRVLEHRETVGVERGREAVDDARVGVLRLHDHALHRQPRDEELLARDGGTSPRALLLARREAADCANAVAEGGRLEQDDHPLADGDARPLVAGQALPARSTQACRRIRAVTAGGDQDERRRGCEESEREGVEGLTRSMRRHRAQDNGDTGWAR